MPTASSKANYKTYEAQARMVRAIVAAHPEVKWNYKEIIACYGSDITEHALHHRFRRVRANAHLIREARKSGCLDMKDLSTDENVLPKTIEGVDKRNIAKYFGQSTGEGIQFQFRQIKKDAQELRDVERSGGNVAACLSLGPSTPSKSTTGARSVVSASRSTGKRSRGGGGKATPAASTFIKRSESDDEDHDDEEEEADFSGMDETPSKRIKTTGGGGSRRSRTPSRKAATQATATIAAAARLESSASPPDMPTPTPTHQHHASMPLPVIGYGDSKPVVDSLFGHVETAHASYGGGGGGGSISVAQPSFEGGYQQQGYYDGDEFDDGDGEI